MIITGKKDKRTKKHTKGDAWHGKEIESLLQMLQDAAGTFHAPRTPQAQEAVVVRRWGVVQKKCTDFPPLC